MTADETPELLRALRDEPIDPAVLEEIRGRVMAGVETRTRRKISWWWAPVAACLALLLVPDPGRHETLRLSRPLPPEPPVITAAKVESRAIRRPPRRIPKPEPLLVKLVTEDPDVVIYWLVD